MVDEQSLLTRHIEFIESTTGDYWLKDVYAYLNLKDEVSRATVRQQSHRFYLKGFITRVGKDDGHYRKVQARKRLDIINADPDVFLDIVYPPFGLERVVKTPSKFLVVTAGANGSGKTALCMNFTLGNLAKHRVYLFVNTEMTANRIKKRLLDHPNIGMYNMDNLEVFEQEDHFEDVIEPAGINVIDYIEVPSERPAMIGEYLAAIQSKLTTGMAFVAIQKKTNSKDRKGVYWEEELGVGGEWSKRKSDLYMTLDHYPANVLKITKARERVNDHVNPVGMKWEFNLVRGINFVKVIDPPGIPSNVVISEMEF